ncbi:hypothetical protein G6R29_00655 [Fructobacillus sp. M2-14]|uniref:DNA-damage-inducible protein J n=1 Tax=Fructobacillus broussonetiae TaxID=2713173 RepID=A0ABS5QY69_9LACO|nr:type II toxin-antitoxin system RelB/DinJ family antitoxin [Fructobacillus broussonetiae]MBS9338148.1 hypothetical protein [Fructobacillus broussonetiae]
MDTPTVTNIPINTYVNDKADSILEKFGMTTTTAIYHFLTSIIETGKLPVQVGMKQKIREAQIDEIVRLVPIGKPIDTKEELLEWLNEDW